MNIIKEMETIIKQFTVTDKLGANLASNAILDKFEELGLELIEKEFKEDLLSVDELDEFEGSLLVYGHYNEKYFGLDIINNDFTLLGDDTECTDKELEDIFKYLMAHKELLKV
jgi:hypothetical protein